MREEMESLWGAMKVSHYKRTIDQLTRSIRDTQSLEDALKVALEMVMRAAHAETGTFWFYDRFKDGRICAKAVCGGSDLSAIRLLPGEGIAGQVIQSRKSVIIQDCQADPRWAGRVDQKTGFQTKSMICVPLALEDVVFGCIQIINKTDGVAFDEEDLAFVERLAAEISVLLKHQGLLEDFVSLTRKAENGGNGAVLFRDIFLAASENELDYQLRSIPEFSALRTSDQQEVLRRAKEIRGYFVKTDRHTR